MAAKSGELSKKKVGAISALSCCGCGGLAFLLLVITGMIGAVFAPPVETPTEHPTAVANEAEPKEAEPTEVEPTAAEPSAAEPSESPTPSPTPTPEPEPEPEPDPTLAAGVLAALEVKGRAPKTGYERDLFGWRDDTDHNGCDTRNDVLRRDLSDIVLKRDTKGCVVLAGTLEDSPYSGESVDFHQQDDNSLDIDHIVALSDAWQTGAADWGEETRREFANDPLNLLAVEDDLNQQKSDGDAATWLPPNKAYRCEFVARQVAVKHKYDLWVKPAEKDAIEGVLDDCEDFPAVEDDHDWPDRWEGDGAREEPEPEPEPEPEATVPESTGDDGSSGGSASGDGSGGTSSGGGSSDGGNGGSSGSDDGDVYYENCDAARAAGAAPVLRGDPGYAPKLDRDGDGIGCE